MVNTATGVVVPASCYRLSCSVCVRVNAFRYARAIGNSHPDNQFLLTQVGDDWGTIHSGLTRFRRVIRRSVDRWEDVFHVEPNPAKTGHHVHGWHWGDTPPIGAVTDAAERAGLGAFADITPRLLERGAPLTYGLKTVLAGSDRKPELPGATQRFLDVNGGRLGHATPGFWRGLSDNPIKGVRQAMKSSSGARTWAVIPDPLAT